MYNATVHNFVCQDSEDAEQEIYEKSMLLTWNTPRWEKELQDITVQEKDRGVELVCICRGLTHPSAKWFHKGKDVFSDFHMKLKQVAETATLTIKAIREQDSGKFKCVMTGENGELETSCVLSIKAPEKIEPPAFVKELHDVEVEEGEKLELDVEVRGTSPVGVFWYHNNVEITHDSPHYLLASLGHVHTLTLLHATSESSGEYVCEAYNDFGDTDTFCFVEVREVEHPEPPDFVTCPMTLTAQEGETATFTCQVKGQPMPSVLWERGGVAIATNQKYKITKIQDQHSLIVYNVDLTDAGEYFCHLHSAESDVSHACTLHVVCETQSEEAETAESMKSRSGHIQDLPSTSQADWMSSMKGDGDNLPESPESLRRFKHQKLKDIEATSENAERETKTPRTAYKTTYETTVGTVSTTCVQSSAIPHTGSGKLSHYNQRQHQPHLDNDSGSHNIKSGIKQYDVSTLHVTENFLHKDSGSRQNLPESMTNSHSVLSKHHKKAEEKRNIINSDVTDFRNVLKHRNRPWSPPQVAKSGTPPSHNVDFRKVLSQDKVKQHSESKFQTETARSGNTRYELVNLPTTQTSDNTFSQGAKFTSLPTSYVSSSDLQNDSQLCRDLSYKNNKATVTDFESTRTQRNLNNLRHYNASSESSVQSSLIERHESRKILNNPACFPSSSEHFDNVSNEQKFHVSTLGNSNKEKMSTQVNEQQYVIIKDNNLKTIDNNQPESSDMSAVCATDDNFGDDIKEVDSTASVDAKMGGTLFKSEIQVMETRKYSRSDHATSVFPHAEQNFTMSLNTRSSPGAHSQGRSESYLNDSDTLNLEAEKLTLRPESQRDNIVQCHKVSVVHFNPQVSSTPPRSEELKLEVTSVTMSIPLRSSTSSPRLYAQPHSVSVPIYISGQSNTENTDTKDEDIDDVFTDMAEETGFVHSEQTSSHDEYKSILQSFGPIFTWEKAPWDATEVVQEGVQSRISAEDKLKKGNDIAQNMNKNSKSSLSENMQDYHKGRQEEGRSASKLSTRSVSDFHSAVSFDVSHKPVSGKNSEGGGSRSVRLTTAGNKGKHDLIRSKFMSASTECVFADVKLKPVSKTDGTWRRSQISLNTETVKDKPKSKDLSDLFSSSSLNKAQKTTQRSNAEAATVTAVKFSNSHKTSRIDAKSLKQPEHSEHDRSVQHSKIRAFAEKYEKSSPASVPRTNTYCKSKGIGAKFEASIKDSKISNRDMFPTSKHTKNNLSELIQPKSPASSDFSSGTVSEKILHWKAAETTSSGKVMKKMLGAIGKSSSNNALLERGSKSYLDKVQEWAVHKRHSLQMNTAPTLPISSRKSVVQHAEFSVVTKTVAPNSSQRLEKNLETAGLNQTSDVDQKREFFENDDKKDPTSVKSDISHAKNVKQTISKSVKSDMSLDKNIKLMESRTVKTDAPEHKNVHINNVALSVGEKRGFPKTVQNELDIKPEWMNRKPMNNIEAKIKANHTTVSLPGRTKPELVNLRQSKQFKQAECAEENKNISKIESDTGYSSTIRDKHSILIPTTGVVAGGETLVKPLEIGVSGELNDKGVSLLSENSLSEAADTKIKTVVTPSNNVMVQITTAVTTVITSVETPGASLVTVAGSAKLASTAAATTTAMGKVGNSFIPEPANMVAPILDSKAWTTSRRRSDTAENQFEDLEESDVSIISSHAHTSNIVRKEEFQADLSNRPTYNKFMQVSTESSTDNKQSNLKGSRSSWVRQKGLRATPVYPVHDIGPEHLKSSMEDSESVLSTASISSSSSDASNVTVDSGYPRYSSRWFIDNDKVDILSKAPYSESSRTSTTVSYAMKHDNEVKHVSADTFKNQENLLETSGTKMNYESPLKVGDSDRNIKILSSDLKHTRGFREEIRDETLTSESPVGTLRLGKSEVPHSTTDNKSLDESEQDRSQRNKLIEECKNQAPENCAQGSEDSERTTDIRESEDVADLTNDFGTTRKYSKKRRKNLQKEENEPDMAVNRPTSSIEPEKSTSRFGSRYRKQKMDSETIKTVSGATLESSEPLKEKYKETVSHFSSEGKQIESDVRIRSRFRQKLNEDNRTAVVVTRTEDSKPLVIRPSELDLNPSWKSSKSQVKTVAKDVIPYNLSQEEKVKLTSSTLVAATYSALSSTSTSALSSTSTSAPQQQLCPPSFPMPLLDATVKYGCKAVLRCQVIGHPRPEVRWLLNQKQLEPSKNIETIYNDVIAQLTVRETFSEHVGDYTCWARNSLGTVSSHCTLNLEASNKIESRALEGPVYLPPRIESFGPTNVSLARGLPLTLTVTFVGEPRPTVRWMHGDKELISDSHVHIVTEGNTSSLTIKSVTQSDAGKMSVCLTSPTGSDQVSTNICIEDVPGVPVGRPHIYDNDKNSVSLSWCGPTSGEGNQVAYYIIEARTRQDKTWDVVVPHCKDSSCHILGLKPCTSYQFRVLAANKHGLSAPSEPSERVITSDPFRSPSDYESEDEFPFEPREVAINTTDKFEDVYELEKEVGKGKFGVVYKSKRKTDGTIWAAKIVKCREKDKNVIRREIEIMNTLRHPKLLLLWDAYESPKQMVLVTEYVCAGELFERVIGEDFVLTECDCIHFLREICEGVNYMHSNCILHLDLKPENILCIAENSNRIKIIDFGLAQFHKPGQSTKVLFGTPEFIAPEVINYEEIGFVTDMWSIGVICYVLLSGLSPFLGDNDAETLANVTSGEFDFDDEAFDEISDEAKRFISQLLVMKKEQRMLTDQCLAHVWLNQAETGGVRRRRLNTERLKRFMVRRKWLKTGNAVLAASRLLKSSNQGGLSPVSYRIQNTHQSSSILPVSTLQRNTEEVVEDLDIHTESVSVKKYLVQCPDRDPGDLKQNLSEANEDIISSLEDNPTSLEGLGDLDKTALSFKNILRNAADGETLTNTAENCVNVSQLVGVSLLAESETDNNTDQNDNRVMNETSQILSPCGGDMNHNVNKTASSVFTESKNSDMLLQRTTVDESGVVLQAPVFTKPMLKSTTCVGDVARFDVVISGDPLPHVTWYFEDEEIHPDSRHVLDSNEKARSFSLIIRCIEEDDEGEYSCKARNSQGESICAAELSVLEI